MAADRINSLSDAQLIDVVDQVISAMTSDRSRATLLASAADTSARLRHTICWTDAALRARSAFSPLTTRTGFAFKYRQGDSARQASFPARPVRN